MATVIPKLVLTWDKPPSNPNGLSGMVFPLLSYKPDYSPACLPQHCITFVFLEDSSWAEQPLCPSHCIPLDISQAISPKPVMLTAPLITAPLSALPQAKDVKPLRSFCDFTTIKKAEKKFMTKYHCSLQFSFWGHLTAKLFLPFRLLQG